jgi:MFS family permease
MPFSRAWLSILSEVLENPRLRRLELSLGGFYASDWAHFVALSVFAYEHGGATMVGIYGLARMTAAAVAAPVGGVLADRHPRQRVLLGIHLGRASALAGAAGALAVGWPVPVVIALATVCSIAGGPFRPAQLALLPSLAETPQQLVAANVTSSTLEGAAALVGPALAGGLLAFTTPAVVVGLSAALSLWAALLALRLGREPDWLRRRNTETPLHETLAGLRTLRRESRPRLLIMLFASQAFVRGLMNVLLVAASLQLFRTGDAGVGYLNAALGVGGVVGGLWTVRLVGRRALATPFALALALWSAPLAALAASRELGWALGFLLIVGGANAILDVTGYTLVQRTVDDAVLSRVFGVFEILASGAVGVGSIVAPLLLHELGVRHALLVVGAILPLLAIVFRRRLVAIDASVDVPDDTVKLLRSTPIFSPLPVTALERLADHVMPIRAQAGETIVHQGKSGDSFYLIVEGWIDVVCDGDHVADLGPGDYFGEIALLHAVPRTATCRAATAAELLCLRGDVFVAAVTGNLRGARNAESVVEQRLAELDELAAARH